MNIIFQKNLTIIITYNITKQCDLFINILSLNLFENFYSLLLFYLYHQLNCFLPVLKSLNQYPSVKLSGTVGRRWVIGPLFCETNVRRRSPTVNIQPCLIDTVNGENEWLEITDSRQQWIPVVSCLESQFIIDFMYDFNKCSILMGINLIGILFQR